MFFIFLSVLIKDFSISAGQSCADIEKKLCANLFFSFDFCWVVMCQHWFPQTIHFDDLVSPHLCIKLNNECALPAWFSYSLYPSLASPFLDMLQQMHFQECWQRKQVDWFGSSCKFFFFVICVHCQFVAVGWAFTAARVNATHITLYEGSTTTGLPNAHSTYSRRDKASYLQTAEWPGKWVVMRWILEPNVNHYCEFLFFYCRFAIYLHWNS
jgi:hypothetical protein